MKFNCEHGQVPKGLEACGYCQAIFLDLADRAKRIVAGEIEPGTHTAKIWLEDYQKAAAPYKEPLGRLTPEARRVAGKVLDEISKRIGSDGQIAAGGVQQLIEVWRADLLCVHEGSGEHCPKCGLARTHWSDR